MKKTLSLKHHFSETELMEIAQELSDQLQKRNAAEEEKKFHTKKFSDIIKHLDVDINSNSQLIEDGFEFRETECTVEYNYPKAGQKTIKRHDTEETWIEQMLESEHTLFNIAGVPDIGEEE